MKIDPQQIGCLIRVIQYENSCRQHSFETERNGSEEVIGESCNIWLQMCDCDRGPRTQFLRHGGGHHDEDNEDNIDHNNCE